MSQKSIFDYNKYGIKKVLAAAEKVQGLLETICEQVPRSPGSHITFVIYGGPGGHT